MGEHVLLSQVKLMSGDPEQHRQVAAVAARVQARLDEALQIEDRDRAAVVLPAALVALYREVSPLFSAGLLPGVTWIDLQHRALYAKAQQVLGPEQRAVQRPPHEPLDLPAGRAGRFRG